MLHDFIDAAKKFYVLNVKGFKAEKMTACTLLLEGDKESMNALHSKVITLAKKFGGMAAGAENGMKGYMLTFLIGYIRDYACDHFVAADSFETSIPWSMVSEMCSRVKKRIYDTGKQCGFPEDKIWVSFRVTQLYETGAAVYTYFTLAYPNFPREKVIAQMTKVEDAARDEIMLCGGCISHHHGVGKLRKGFIHRTMPPMAIKIQQEIKKAFDPTNVFGINNTIYQTSEENEAVKIHF